MEDLKLVRAAILCLLAVAACSPEQEPDVTVRGLPYSFPAEDVDQWVRPNEGRPYVRLNEASNVILIYDFTANRMESEEGRTVLSGVNLSEFETVEHFTVGDIEVICRNRPGYNCGICVVDGDVMWTALFMQDHIGDAVGIKERSLRELATYREN